MSITSSPLPKSVIVHGGISTVPAIEHVGAGAAFQEVRGRPAHERVIAPAPVEPVVARSPVQCVVALVPAETAAFRGEFLRVGVVVASREQVGMVGSRGRFRYP